MSDVSLSSLIGPTTISGDATGTNVAGDIAITIANSAVTNAKMANMAVNTIKGNSIGGGAPPADLSVGDVKGMLSISNVENTALSTWAGTTNITTLGTIATGTWSATAIAANKGGTGQTSYTIGDLLQASASGTLSVLAAVATGNVLISGGVGTVSSWGKVGLTTHVSGILPGANGGTNNGFMDFTGPATSLKTFTLPNASAVILTDNAAVTVAQGGTGRATSTTAYGLLAAGTTATGAHQTVATGTSSQVLVGGGASALPSWTNTPTLTGTNFTGIPNGALTNSSVTVGSTAIALGASATTIAGLSSVTSTTFVGALTGTATASSTATIVNDTTTNADMYPVWVTANTGNLPLKVSSTKMSYNPSTGTLSLTTSTNDGIIVYSAGRAGLRVSDSSPSGAAPWVEVIGDRNTSSADMAFGGFYVAAADRTDAEIPNAKQLGGIAFGGTITPNDKTSLRVAASISAFADGAWPVGGATAPIGIRIYVGDVPQTLGTTGVTYGAVNALEIGKLGNIGVGGARGADQIMRITKAMTGGVTAYGVRLASETQSDVTTSSIGFSTALSTAAASFTLTQMTHYQAAGSTIGAGSSITTQYGFLVSANMTGAATNIGFLGNLADATNVWNFYAQGTAPNFFAGDVRIGQVSDLNAKLSIQGNLTGAITSYAMRVGGTVQSDVTTSFYGLAIAPATQATAFTLTNMFGVSVSDGSKGAGSTITNNYGYYCSSLSNGTNNYGFYSNVADASTSWNVYANGTAHNYMAGDLRLGAVSDVNCKLLIAGNSTGTTARSGIRNTQTVQSDVTSSYYGHYSLISTQATTFTLGTLAHYVASEGTKGAGSTITTQIGFFAPNNGNGNSNMGFYGSMTAAANKWNLYMLGTAKNYLEGSLLIGSATDDGVHKLQLTGTLWTSSNAVIGGTPSPLFDYGTLTIGGVTSGGGASRHTGVIVNQIVDTTEPTGELVGFSTWFTHNSGTYTIPSYYGFLSEAIVVSGGTPAVTNFFGFYSNVADNNGNGTTAYSFYSNAATGTGGRTRWNFYAAGSASNYMAGNLLVGSSTDGGEKLQVTGTSRFTSTMAVNTAITPVTNDATSLGTTSLKFSDLFLATGAVIDANSGNTTLTMNGAGLITIGGSQTNGISLKLAAGGTTLAPLSLTSGTNKTTVAAGDVEFDGVNYYATIDTTSGRGSVPVEQSYHLTAAGSTISTIANFFGANSNISLVASAYYEIEIMLVFLKTTASTVTITLTNSAAPTSQNIYWEQSPITGIVAPPGTATALTGFTYNDATAARAYTTGSLTTGVNHYINIKIRLRNGAGTSLKIQATSTSGTITPGIGSFWRARRISPNNIGTFAA